jgi:hypothetical protein
MNVLHTIDAGGMIEVRLVYRAWFNCSSVRSMLDAWAGVFCSACPLLCDRGVSALPFGS